MKKWFDVSLAADGGQADIAIFGPIGDWMDDMFPSGGVTTAKSFVDALAKLPASVKTVRVRINSPGGDAFGGITIANALRAEVARGRKVETVIEGLAASAASIVAMGGSSILMSDNGLMMVHAPWSVAVGNAADMRATADLLDQVRDSLVKTYQWHSPLDEADILALIDGEGGKGTWMDADDALTYGFATDKIAGLKAAASLDPAALAKLQIPEKFQSQVAALARTADEPAAPPAEPPVDPPVASARPEDVIAMCETAGLDISFARQLLQERVAPEAAALMVGAERDRRAADATRRQEIAALCARFKCDDLLPTLTGLPFDDAKAIVAGVAAKVDKVEIDALLPPHGDGPPKQPRVDTAAIYRARNQAPGDNVSPFKRSER